jgi:hypothetical protein
MTVDYNFFLAELQKLNDRSIVNSRTLRDEIVLPLDKHFRFFLDKEPKPEVYLLWVIFTLLDFHDNSFAKKICEEWFEKCEDALALIFHAFILEEYERGIPTPLYDRLRIIEAISKRDQSIISMYLGTYQKSESFFSQAIHRIGNRCPHGLKTHCHQRDHHR